MVTFRQKNIIAAKSLGEDLHKARLVLNLSLLAVEKKMGIAKQYLEALENNNWEALPGEVYAKNWLKKYASFLGFNWSEIETRFREEMRGQEIWPISDQHRFGVARKRLVVLPKILMNIIILIVVVVIVGYLGAQLWSLSSPPELELLYPEDNFTTESRFVKILGRVEEGALLMLNDQEITGGEDGWFEVDIDLNKGLNVIKIEAKKSYGRTRTEYLRVFAGDKEGLLITN